MTETSNYFLLQSRKPKTDRHKYKSLILVFLLMPTYSWASLFSSKNYEQCVLEGLKNAHTEYAVKVLQSLCSEKFSANESNKKNSFLTDTDCYLEYKEGQVDFGRREKKSHLTVMVTYGDYMNVHFAIPKLIADRLRLSELIAARKVQIQDMPNSARRFMKNLYDSAEILCRLR
jgi:hypothetical protein